MSSKTAVRQPASFMSEQQECLAKAMQQDEIPIAGLRASSTGPTPFGQTTCFYATVDFGTNVRYEWDCGDGHVVYGASIRHIYAEPGEYLVTVIARNDLSEMEATTFAVVDYREVWDAVPSSTNPLDLDDEEIDVDSQEPDNQPFAMNLFTRRRDDQMWQMDERSEEMFCE